MNENRLFNVVIAIFFGSMPFWLSFIANLAQSVRIRKIVLATLVVLYHFLVILLLVKITPDTFADIYAQYGTGCVLFLHWTFVMFVAYRL
jgi:hypothetical protein